MENQKIRLSEQEALGLFEGEPWILQMKKMGSRGVLLASVQKANEAVGRTGFTPGEF